MSWDSLLSGYDVPSYLRDLATGHISPALSAAIPAGLGKHTLDGGPFWMLAAALAVKLAEGKTLTKAAAEAKAYLTGAIEAAKDETIGQGSGPVRHFWFCKTHGG